MALVAYNYSKRADYNYYSNPASRTKRKRMAVPSDF